MARRRWSVLLGLLALLVIVGEASSRSSFLDASSKKSNLPASILRKRTAGCPNEQLCDQAYNRLCGNSDGIERDVCYILDIVCKLVICQAVDEVANHLPLEDLDNDYYSTIFGFRGSAWRGKDCDDGLNTVYPGRKTPLGVIPYADYNCNGISGRNASGNYKDLFCKGSQQRGVIVLSDSTGAMFGPPIYPFADAETWTDVTENEFNWPQCSWATAYESTANCEHQFVPQQVDSIYLKMWRRNRCNFRDYQNIAVDGSRSSSMATNIVGTTARDHLSDHPAVVFFALVANDVCNPHPGSSSMTSPEEFLANNLKSLQWLDQHLPAGSHVVFIGLFHGELLWDIMHNQPYPYFGLTYGELWELLSSVYTGGGDNRTLNPCWGWLNPDPYWRNVSTTQAQKLNAVYQYILNTKKFKNFDMYYMDHPDAQVAQQWVKAGNDPKYLFQEVGGGHPSQEASTLWANAIWTYIEQHWPQILGPVNPHNAEIAQMFGDQGGY